MGFISLISGAFKAFNAVISNLSRSADKKAGVRQADIAARDKIDEIKETAKKVRSRPTRKRADSLKRMRRSDGNNKRKG